MNATNVFSIPVAGDVQIQEYLRVKIVAGGTVEVANKGELGVGVLLQPINTERGRRVADILKPSAAALTFAHIKGSVAAGEKVKLDDGGTYSASGAPKLIHDGSASSNKAIKVQIGDDGVSGYLNATFTGSASILWDVGGGIVLLKHTASSPVGTVVYFEQSTGKLLTVSPTGGDISVPVSNGASLRIEHSADAATRGIAIYADAGADSDKAMTFESPTTTDGTALIDDAFDRGSVAIAIEDAADGDIIRICYL